MFGEAYPRLYCDVKSGRSSVVKVKISFMMQCMLMTESRIIVLADLWKVVNIIEALETHWM